MGKYKEKPKYNVVSMRITDEERASLNEMTLQSSKSISVLMREAIQQYTQQSETSVNQETSSS
jgi:predicted DNA-binding protein